MEPREQPNLLDYERSRPDRIEICRVVTYPYSIGCAIGTLASSMANTVLSVNGSFSFFEIAFLCLATVPAMGFSSLLMRVMLAVLGVNDTTRTTAKPRWTSTVFGLATAIFGYVVGMIASKVIKQVSLTVVVAAGMTAFAVGIFCSAFCLSHLLRLARRNSGAE